MPFVKDVFALVRRIAGLALVLALASSCATPNPGSGAGGTAANPPAGAGPVDFAALAPKPAPTMPHPALRHGGSGDVSEAALANAPVLDSPEVYPAKGPSLGPVGETGSVAPDPNGVTLNFVNTDIHQVIDVVFGETLGLNYTISPKVKGTITARTSKPLPRRAVLATIESVLAMNGIAVVPSDGVYQIVPMADTADQIPVPRPSSAELGYGLHIVPLKYVSAREVATLMQSYMPPGRTIQTLDSANVILFTGTNDEARQLEDLADTFDVDWMRGRTFALLPVTYADVSSITHELQTVFGLKHDSSLKGPVAFVPIERLNAVLVMASTPSYVDEAKTWVKRLDRKAIGGGRTTYVYEVQNARAVDLAKVLRSLYGSSDAASSSSVAPGEAPNVFSRMPANAPAGSGLTAATGPSSAGTDDGASTDAGAGGPAGFDTKNGIRIVADNSRNALLISCSREQYEDIQSVLRQLDKVPLQVEIDATIAEVTLTDQLKYGLEWYFKTGQGKSILSQATDGAIKSTFPGFSYFLNTHGGDIQAVLDALSHITKVHIISSPTVLVLNNQQARLQVGDEVPVATQSSVSTISSNAPVVNQIQFRDTGVILEVTPRVNSSGLIMLDVSQEVSDVINTTTSKLDSPTVRQRKLASAVAVQSGDTVALGGLIQDSTNRINSGVPLLSDIPVLGHAFKSTDDTHTRTELLVLITPRIARSTKDAQVLTDALRKRLGALEPLRKQLNNPNADNETGVIGRLRSGNFDY